LGHTAATGLEVRDSAGSGSVVVSVRGRIAHLRVVILAVVKATTAASLGKASAILAVRAVTELLVVCRGLGVAPSMGAGSHRCGVRNRVLLHVAIALVEATKGWGLAGGIARTAAALLLRHLRDGGRGVGRRRDGGSASGDGHRGRTARLGSAVRDSGRCLEAELDVLRAAVGEVARGGGAGESNGALSAVLTSGAVQAAA
jgi:hypothetical protein